MPCPRRLSEGDGGVAILFHVTQPSHLVVRGVMVVIFNRDWPSHLVVREPCFGRLGPDSHPTEWSGYQYPTLRHPTVWSGTAEVGAGFTLLLQKRDKQ